MQEAKKVGDEFLALEKYVNLNYLVRFKNGKLALGNVRCLIAPVCKWCFDVQFKVNT